MKNQIKFSFDDEPVIAFFYEIGNRKMVCYFSGCWDVATRLRISKQCYFSIEDWSRIHCLIGPESERKDFEQSMGIVRLFLLVKYDEINDILETSVLTVDGRFIELKIHNPKFEMDVLTSAKSIL